MSVLTERAEATDMLVAVLQEYVRDGRCVATLVIEDMAVDEWDEAPGIHTGPRSKRELVGPHAIEYRKGES